MDQAQLPQASALVHQQVTAGTGAGASSPGKTLVRTINPGDRVNIPCSLAQMGGSIQFAKDNKPIILDQGCVHCQLDISNDGQASLTINRVSRRDEGHWECWRLDAAGVVKQRTPIIQLAVTNSPELPILMVNDKELLGGNNLDATITVKENELVSFKCVIKGAATPVEYVHWILDSSTNVTSMSQLVMEYSAQDNNYLTQSVLKLNATKSMNLKSISCLSNHQLWLTPMTVTALLNVLYEPSFTISREPGFGVPVSEGTTVILKCEIDSNPVSQPIWIKDADNKTQGAPGGQNLNSQAGAQQQQQQQQHQFTGKESSAEPIVLDTQEDGSVVFQPARRQDSGWYRCKTENKYGNFSSFGYYLNVRASSSGASGAISAASPATASNTQQPVRARSDPARVMSPNQPAALTGAQLGLPPPPPPPGHAFMPPTLRPQVLSGGAYNDAASNSNGASNPLQRSQLANDQPAQFNPVQHFSASDEREPAAKSSQFGLPAGFPEIRNPSSTVFATLGRQLILPLRFCCQPGPARVFWIHRHLAMIPGRMFGPYITRDVYPTYNSFHCYETTFEIEQVKPEDIGTVFVFVSNERGHAGATISIQLAKQGGLQAPTSDAVGGQHNRYNAAPNLLGSRFPLLNGGFQSSSAAPPNSPLALIWTIALVALTATIFQVSSPRRRHALAAPPEGSSEAISPRSSSSSLSQGSNQVHEGYEQADGRQQQRRRRRRRHRSMRVTGDIR